MFENTAQRASSHSSSDGHLTPIKRPTLKNVINKRPSVISGQCPFSGHKVEFQTPDT